MYDSIYKQPEALPLDFEKLVEETSYDDAVAQTNIYLRAFKNLILTTTKRKDRRSAQGQQHHNSLYNSAYAYAVRYNLPKEDRTKFVNLVIDYDLALRVPTETLYDRMCLYKKALNALGYKAEGGMFAKYDLEG